MLGDKTNSTGSEDFHLKYKKVQRIKLTAKTLNFKSLLQAFVPQNKTTKMVEFRHLQFKDLEISMGEAILQEPDLKMLFSKV